MYDTIESAQERIVELEEELASVKAERDTLSENNNTLTEKLEESRTLNQKYFNKLIAQDTEENNDEDQEPEIVPCEEFAKSLNII